MSRRLILMRHAKSDWANHQLSDHDRPLNERGRRTAPLMAQHFANKNLVPCAIVASTAARVRETVALMLAEWRHAPVVSFHQSLYLASVETLSAQVRELQDSCSSTMIVGHNPGLMDFVSWLSGHSLEMPTAGVAVFESTVSTWSGALVARDWQLTAHWRPRDLFD